MISWWESFLHTTTSNEEKKGLQSISLLFCTNWFEVGNKAKYMYTRNQKMYDGCLKKERKKLCIYTIFLWKMKGLTNKTVWICILCKCVFFSPIFLLLLCTFYIASHLLLEETTHNIFPSMYTILWWWRKGKKSVEKKFVFFLFLLSFLASLVYFFSRATFLFPFFGRWCWQLCIDPRTHFPFSSSSPFFLSLPSQLP